jgi:hypothetical protein
MSKQNKHAHNKDQHGHDHHAAGGAKKKLIHHDWRFWTAIVLMGLAMVAYVVSFDESFRPGGGEQPEVPADAE